MTTPKNRRASGIIKADISKLSPDARLAYGRHLAAQKRYDFLSELCIGQITVPMGGEDLDNFANQASRVTSWVQSDHGREMAATAQLVAVLEASQPYAEAREKLVPLLAELETSSKAEAAHAHSVNQAKDGLRIAEEEAKAKAIEASANDAAVVAARKALESKLEKVS